MSARCISVRGGGKPEQLPVPPDELLRWLARFTLEGTEIRLYQGAVTFDGHQIATGAWLNGRMHDQLQGLLSKEDYAALSELPASDNNQV